MHSLHEHRIEALSKLWHSHGPGVKIQAKVWDIIKPVNWVCSHILYIRLFWHTGYVGFFCLLKKKNAKNKSVKISIHINGTLVKWNRAKDISSQISIYFLYGEKLAKYSPIQNDPMCVIQRLNWIKILKLVTLWSSNQTVCLKHHVWFSGLCLLTRYNMQIWSFRLNQWFTIKVPPLICFIYMQNKITLHPFHS